MSSAINLLARGYRMEVSTDGTAWVQPMGMRNFSAPISPNLETADHYDTDGWNGFEKTMQGWVISADFDPQATAGVLDPGFQILLDAVDKFGDAARVHVRWFRKDGVAGWPSYQGVGLVEAVPSNTAAKDIGTHSVKITGDGAASPISNPYSAALVPTITSVTPASGSASGGELVTISGQYFTGVTAVTFDGVAAEDFNFISDIVVSAIVPAGTAGPADVVVTNATGPSTTGTAKFSYA